MAGINGERTGSGTIVWKARELLATGKIDYEGFVELVATSAPSTGFCNTMGTANIDELAGRGARHDAARQCRDPRALSRARPDGL